MTSQSIRHTYLPVYGTITDGETVRWGKGAVRNMPSLYEYDVYVWYGSLLLYLDTNTASRQRCSHLVVSWSLTAVVDTHS